jgi:hypothetical protein
MQKKTLSEVLERKHLEFKIAAIRPFMRRIPEASFYKMNSPPGGEVVT